MRELPRSWDVEACREVAEGFSERAFDERIAAVLAGIGTRGPRDDVRD